MQQTQTDKEQFSKWWSRHKFLGQEQVQAEVRQLTTPDGQLSHQKASSKYSEAGNQAHQTLEFQLLGERITKFEQKVAFTYLKTKVLHLS